MSSATQTPIASIPAFLQRAGKWYLLSGIQELSGGVARYYRIDLARNNRLSTEITGYTISALCQLHRATNDPALVTAAQRAARFLVSDAWDPTNSIFPFEWPPTADPSENRAFFFDSGIIARGLLTLHRLTGDAAYRDAAIACGKGMAAAFERNQAYAPILQLPNLDALPPGNTWSNNPGCYQLKSALAWHELALETNDPVFRTHWETALQRAVDNDTAFLPGTPERLRIMDRLHAYSYYLEALLSVADRPICRQALTTGIERAADYLHNIAPDFARSDVYAQILRVRLLAHHQGAVTLNETRAQIEADAIPTFQYESQDPHLHGGFSFGRRDGQLMPFANPVSTAFCAQALDMWHHHLNGNFHFTWKDLI
ncbi:MAG: hypothetical protein HY820_28490 [Acidobacteria bacterium]|nr:hypothetical protein [Acidobacteriota bacterium]